MSELTPLERRDPVGQTFASRYDVCPRSAYLYGQREVRSHEMDRGVLFHAALEKGEWLMLELDEPRIQTDVLKTLLEEAHAEHPELTVPRAELDDVRFMLHHWAEAVELPLARVLGIEMGLSFDLAGYTFRGRPDLVLVGEADGVLEVWDWKSGYGLPAQEEYDRAFQPWSYAALALLGRTESGQCFGDGFQFVTTREIYPRFVRDDGRLHERSHTKTRMEVMEWHLDLELLLRKLDREWSQQEWRAVPGSHCSTCAAPAACPIPAEWRNHAGTINTVEEAAEAIAWAERMADRVSATRAEVKEIAKVLGPIPVGKDLEFGPVVSESVRLRQRKGRTDVDGLREAVQAAVEYGAPFEPEEFFRPQVSTSWKVHRREEGEAA